MYVCMYVCINIKMHVWPANECRYKDRLVKRKRYIRIASAICRYTLTCYGRLCSTNRLDRRVSVGKVGSINCLAFGALVSRMHQSSLAREVPAMVLF